MRVGPPAKAVWFSLFMLALSPAIAIAQGGPVVLTFPVSGTIANPCIAGEVIAVEGQTTFSFYTRINGTMIHISTRIITKLRGTTLDLMKKYVVNDEDLSEVNFVGATSMNREINSVMVRQGETVGDVEIGGFGDDFKLKSKFHLTLNANGVPTVSVDETTAECM
jgi:hypothetical protein